ncbi:MAG: carbonic anhydrase [Flavobacteriales bacterium]
MQRSYDQVFENNKKWISDNLAKDENFFQHLAKGQSPEFLYIGCADSRVPANEIMGLEPGEVFVHRNIANMVVNTDMNAQSVIQYAVEHLEVKHVVVCGHYNCGGVKAAMGNSSLGLLDGWLREIRDVYRLHSTTLNAIEDEHERYNKLIELNVMEQCFNVMKTAFVQKSYAQKKFPQVHGWVYDLANGELIDLNFDFEGALKKIQEVYDITK